MKQVVLSKIDIGGSFRFGGVWFRSDKVDESDEELILCQIGNHNTTKKNQKSPRPEIKWVNAFVYIANHTIVEVD